MALNNYASDMADDHIDGSPLLQPNRQVHKVNTCLNSERSRDEISDVTMSAFEALVEHFPTVQLPHQTSTNMFGYIEAKPIATNKIKSKSKPIFGLEDSQSEQYPFEMEEVDVELKIHK